MSVTLNHAIVPALDAAAEGGFLASIIGLEVLPRAGWDGRFTPVRVNETLTLDFLTVEDPPGLHLAFDVDPETFDAILARLRAAGVPYGDDPSRPDNGGTAHPLRPRGLYFADGSGNLYEVMSPA